MKKKKRSTKASPPQRRGPQAIKDVMAGLMARRGYAQVETADESQAAWQEVADEFSEDTCAGITRRGVLQVIVRNSVVLQELTFRQSMLLKELQNRLPEHKITGIRFRVGDVD